MSERQAELINIINVKPVVAPNISCWIYLFIGFFNTGAYQESIGGFGGLQHCLIPHPKHIIIDKDLDGNLITKLFKEQQNSEEFLKILGYENK